MAFGVRLHCWGEWACFTRPEMKVERVSYDAMTPSAARGVIEAIYWKPEIRWVIDSITVLKPIQFVSVRRNEVKDKIGAGSVAKAMKDGSGALSYCVDDGDNRQQRATLMLRDVAYVIEAHFDILSGPDNHAKHLDQFNRRARNGACFTRPYLGCREFAAHFALIEGEVEAPAIDSSLAGERDLGWMLHDLDFGKEKEARFFRATMRDGRIDTRPPAAGASA
ncbi:CRISPR-associated protein, Cas5d family [Granulicella rosea]|uniref:pre-crRNA processing endonuclease n=1 Tax=Granulicella rosea TaxID=474952 RepID=A0A239K6B4_9BACT|nr:type I-C CRISPR-associated protein Cas5c [Granulicella rosea]SNT13288.1 CRISPR-associated protein, Cas5d family [Granulicella rosea]